MSGFQTSRAGPRPYRPSGAVKDAEQALRLVLASAFTLSLALTLAAGPLDLHGPMWLPIRLALMALVVLVLPSWGCLAIARRKDDRFGRAHVDRPLMRLIQWVFIALTAVVISVLLVLLGFLFLTSLVGFD